MRSVFLLPLTAAVAPLVAAITLHKRDVPAVVELPLERRQNVGAFSKRDSSVGVSISNEVPVPFYIRNLSCIIDQTLKLTESDRGKLVTC